jgi:FkbM family methyltransferase
MNFKAWLISEARNLCRRFGYDLHPVRAPEESPAVDSVRAPEEATTLDSALRRLKLHGISFDSFLDVGASDGIWSRALAEHFPGKRHLLLDANKIHLPALAKICQEYENWSFQFTAVGGKSGTLYFDDSDPLVGHLSERPLNENYKPCPVATIDQIVAEQQLSGPFMIKLDTHGVEIPILQGAVETLQTTNVLVIEAYNFTFGGSAVPFWELCRQMVQLGFRPLDVFDILYREVDRAFWQFDLLFARADLPLFADWRYFIGKRH